MDVLQNMMLFSELVQCGGNVYTWCYDAKGKLLRSNCPDEAFLASAFELFGCKQRMLEHGNRDDVPVTLGTALGLLWGAAFEKEEGKLKRVWVIGPVFHRDVTMRGIEDGLKYYSKLEISVAWTIQLYKALEKVSTLQNTIIYRYLLMMHYCLTGQRLELSCVNSSARPPSSCSPLWSAVPPLRAACPRRRHIRLGTATFRRQKRQNRWMSWPPLQ